MIKHSRMKHHFCLYAEADVRAAQEKVDVLSGQLAGLDFKFKDPEARFDRNRVKGVVAKLMQVKDPAMSTALEVVAGGKLYQVVVDTEVTGKALLSKGQLQKRVTIIPLNKIDARTCNERQVAAADRASRGEAKLALSLVTCDAEVNNVMSYVFGKAFVCKDAATARAVAFDKEAGSVRLVYLFTRAFAPSIRGLKQRGRGECACFTVVMNSSKRTS